LDARSAAFFPHIGSGSGCDLRTCFTCWWVDNERFEQQASRPLAASVKNSGKVGSIAASMQSISTTALIDCAILKTNSATLLFTRRQFTTDVLQ